MVNKKRMYYLYFVFNNTTPQWIRVFQKDGGGWQWMGSGPEYQGILDVNPYSLTGFMEWIDKDVTPGAVFSGYSILAILTEGDIETPEKQKDTLDSNIRVRVFTPPN